jgi:hypothetical protein
VAIKLVIGYWSIVIGYGLRQQQHPGCHARAGIRDVGLRHPAVSAGILRSSRRMTAVEGFCIVVAIRFSIFRRNPSNTTTMHALLQIPARFSVCPMANH